MTVQNGNAEERGDAENAEGGSLTFMNIVMSTLAAAIGVQSKANKERDFKHGSAGPFIVAGLIFTALFVGTLVLIVRWVLSSATG
jgi:L-aminopeptidase/D-esterase-like protein